MLGAVRNTLYVLWLCHRHNKKVKAGYVEHLPYARENPKGKSASVSYAC